MIHIVARHVGILDFDGLTWSDIRQGAYDFVVAKHNDLLDAAQSGAVQCGCGVGPSDMGLQFGIRNRSHGEIGGSRWRLVVNGCRNEVEHGISWTGVRCLVDDIPAIGAAAPAEVEMEHVVVVVTIANEGVATTVLTTAVIHRPTHVELFAHHGLPFLQLKVVATKLNNGIAIVEIVVHHTWNGTRSATTAIRAIAHVDGHAAMEA